MPGRIVFIGGTGRCGTTILRDCLCKHPEITSTPYKWRFIVDPDGLIDFYVGVTETWSPYIYDRKLKRLEELFRRLEYKSGDEPYWEYRLGMWLPNYRKHVDTLLEELTQFTYSNQWVGSRSIEGTIRYRYFSRGLSGAIRDFITGLVDDYLREHGGSIFIDADTWNILFFRDILRILPEAKLIHIWRDPIETICSLAKQRWMPGDIAKAAMVYRDILMRWEAIRHSIPAQTYTQIQLEELVDRPEIIMRDLCGWLGVDYNETMVSPVKRPPSRAIHLDRNTIVKLCATLRFTREAGYESPYCM